VNNFFEDDSLADPLIPKLAPWFGVFRGERFIDWHLTLEEKRSVR
jgi:hypothetical protein